MNSFILGTMTLIITIMLSDLVTHTQKDTEVVLTESKNPKRTKGGWETGLPHLEQDLCQNDLVDVFKIYQRLNTSTLGKSKRTKAPYEIWFLSGFGCPSSPHLIGHMHLVNQPQGQVRKPINADCCGPGMLVQSRGNWTYEQSFSISVIRVVYSHFWLYQTESLSSKKNEEAKSIKKKKKQNKKNSR